MRDAVTGNGDGDGSGVGEGGGGGGGGDDDRGCGGGGGGGDDCGFDSGATDVERHSQHLCSSTQGPTRHCGVALSVPESPYTFKFRDPKIKDPDFKSPVLSRIQTVAKPFQIGLKVLGRPVVSCLMIF
jgi:hypothetical protein